ncbi:MAG: hypothetical protein QMD86_01730 [Patescibacteria group bacterium]|nr:hypothetical protein [Patescibacteria group bacterium]
MGKGEILKTANVVLLVVYGLLVFSILVLSRDWESKIVAVDGAHKKTKTFNEVHKGDNQ